MKNKIKIKGNASITPLITTNNITSSSYVWNGGIVSDNFSTYYLDKNFKKKKL